MKGLVLHMNIRNSEQSMDYRQVGGGNFGIGDAQNNRCHGNRCIKF